MPLTKSQRAQALEHILTNVFDLEANDPLRASLRDDGIVGIYDLVSMEREYVKSLTYLDEVDGTQQRTLVPRGTARLIIILKDFLRYKVAMGEPVDDDWTGITQEEFDSFRVSGVYLEATAMANGGIPLFKPITNSSTAHPTVSTTPATTYVQPSAVEMFKKGIKRDQNLFPTLKEEELHDPWHRKFEIQSHSQAVTNIVDSKYLPSNPNEKEVFQPIKTSMDAVLESKVQTSKGKEAIREHKATKDAPAAYTDLVERHRKSNAANIESTKTNITTTTFSDGEFKGTTSEFLTNWTKKLKPYGNLTGNGSVFGEIVKVVHFSQAIATVPGLRQVKLTADMLRMSTKNLIDFQHYCRLVSAAVVQFDDSLTHKDDPWDPGDSNHIDPPVSHFEPKAYMSALRRQGGQSMGSPNHRRNQRILLPKEVWHAFSDEGKVAWDTLPEADRTMIFAKIQPTNNPRMVQLHQLNQGANSLANPTVETEQCHDKLQDHNPPQWQPSRSPPCHIWAILSSKDKSIPARQANMCVTSRPVILILHQYALVGRGHSIHSPGQLEWFKHSVCDKSVHVGGLQRIKTADDYTIPIAMVHGLPCVRMRPPTDKEFNTLPHIVMTSDTTWTPSVLDFDHGEADDQWFDAIEHQEAHPYSELFYKCGNYCQDVTVQLPDTLCRPSSDPSEHLIDQCIVHANCKHELFFFDAWGAPTIFDADSAPIYISGRVKIVSLPALLGVTVDSSVFLWYHLWQPVEHALTWTFLDAVTSILLHLCPTSDGAPNIRLGTIGGEAPSYVRPTISSKFTFSKFDDPPNDGTKCTIQTSQGTQNKRYSVINDRGDILVRLIGIIRTTKEIRIRLDVAVNHDGHYKAWLIGDRNLIVDHLESVYYGVVSMRSVFLAELNGLEFWSTDIGNAHLESYPHQENHILIISRAPHGQRDLYDLKLSGQGWYDELHDCLVALGLLPCRAEPDIWMRKNGELQVWKYVVLYIGDLPIAMQHPRVPIGSLTPKLFEFKLKGIGKISHHLRVQYSQDKDRMLQSQQNKYPKKMTEGYVHFFGSKSRTNACVPLEKGDHPETNLRSFLDQVLSITHWSLIQDTPRYRHLRKITRIHSCLSFVV
ncbi:reverse transcriptase RNA-dependent DNA polymerase [Nitzschia inconspicua]|uniref:Reverse transcriptase RNA-dependent DNA polymerase n=1 Tax=Nitzschia inconspicua TaxID=303405 RepID=A0A9K3LH19_9STRA|nr:reverse transcriptase RNA-dependent DNA polymerase [Nitzschia inconspicua]